MQSKPSLTLVIPVLNEAGVIVPTIESCFAELRRIEEAGIASPCRLVVVDDGSDDGTAELAEKRDGVILVRHDRNIGYGAALKTGFTAAPATHLAFLDADGTYPVDRLGFLLETALEHDADMVVGDRMGKAGVVRDMTKNSGSRDCGKDDESDSGSGCGMPLTRRLGNAFFARLLSALSGTRISDCASGMRILKEGALAKLPPLPDGLDFTPALSARAVYAGLKTIEVPIPYCERVGKSKLSLVGDGFRFLGSILSVALVCGPRRIFGALGASCLAAALLLGLIPTAGYLSTRTVPDAYIPHLIGVLALASAGISLAAFGSLVSLVLAIHSGKSDDTSGKSFWRGHAGASGLGRGALILFAAGGVLTARPVFIIISGKVAHWSFWLAGAFLLLLALQLGTFWILSSILTVVAGEKPRLAAKKKNHSTE